MISFYIVCTVYTEYIIISSNAMGLDLPNTVMISLNKTPPSPFPPSLFDDNNV